MKFVILVILVAVFANFSLAQLGTSIYVNDIELREDEVQTLESTYFLQIPAGSFWYDPVSGLVGVEGSPPSGQILPGLALGGALRENASGSGTGVFINGRELHPLEIVYLQQHFGVVYPGRYWMNAQFIGGLEGGVPFFNLASLSGGASSAHSQYGTTVSDGSFTGYMPNKSYDFNDSNDVGVSCGPDGGCIYD